MKNGIMFASLLAALSTSPLLLASRQAYAEDASLHISPTSGPKSIQTSWTNYVTLTGSSSTWDSFSWYYDFGGSITQVWHYKDLNDGGAGTFTLYGFPATDTFFDLPGTYYCYAHDYGTDGMGHNWNLLVPSSGVKVIIS